MGVFRWLIMKNPISTTILEVESLEATLWYFPNGAAPLATRRKGRLPPPDRDRWLSLLAQGRCARLGRILRDQRDGWAGLHRRAPRTGPQACLCLKPRVGDLRTPARG